MGYASYNTPSVEGVIVDSPRELRLHTWYVLGALTLIFKIALVITLFICLGCSHGNFNKIPYTESARVKVFRAKQIWRGPCYESRVRRAREILLLGEGRPYVALYYMRCVERPKNKQTLKPKRRRQ